MYPDHKIANITFRVTMSWKTFKNGQHVEMEMLDYVLYMF